MELRAVVDDACMHNRPRNVHCIETGMLPTYYDSHVFAIIVMAVFLFTSIFHIIFIIII